MALRKASPVGFLDDLKKNLGLGQKDEERVRPQTGAGAETSASRNSGSDGGPLEEAATVIQEAAADAVVDAQPDTQAADVPPVAEALVEPVAEPELAEPVLAEPVLTEPVALDEAGTVAEVVVEAGDTMAGIARQYGVDVDELIAANTDTVPNPDHIYPGQVLRLP